MKNNHTVFQSEIVMSWRKETDIAIAKDLATYQENVFDPPKMDH